MCGAPKPSAAAGSAGAGLSTDLRAVGAVPAGTGAGAGAGAGAGTGAGASDPRLRQVPDYGGASARGKVVRREDGRIDLRGALAGYNSRHFLPKTLEADHVAPVSLFNHAINNVDGARTHITDTDILNFARVVNGHANLNPVPKAINRRRGVLAADLTRMLTKGKPVPTERSAEFRLFADSVISHIDGMVERGVFNGLHPAVMAELERVVSLLELNVTGHTSAERRRKYTSKYVDAAVTAAKLKRQRKASLKTARDEVLSDPYFKKQKKLYKPWKTDYASVNRRRVAAKKAGLPLPELPPMPEGVPTDQEIMWGRSLMEKFRHERIAQRRQRRATDSGYNPNWPTNADWTRMATGGCMNPAQVPPFIRMMHGPGGAAYVPSADVLGGTMKPYTFADYFNFVNGGSS